MLRPSWCEARGGSRPSETSMLRSTRAVAGLGTCQRVPGLLLPHLQSQLAATLPSHVFRQPAKIVLPAVLAGNGSFSTELRTQIRTSVPFRQFRGLSPSSWHPRGTLPAEKSLGDVTREVSSRPQFRLPLGTPRRQARAQGRRGVWVEAAVSGEPRTVVRVKGLRADDIRHPLDRQNTALLRAIPGLNEVGKMLLGPIQEQILVLENLGAGVHVTEQQLPALHSLLTQAADLLEMPAPELYVRQNPVPNAYTLAITGRKPFIVVHTALLDLLSPAETQAVLAHELGHLKCDHGIWLTFANLLALGAYSLPGGLGTMIASSVEDQLMRWLRAAELTCDRAALVVAQDPRIVISVLMKLAGGSVALAHQLNVDAFLEQARSYDEAASSSPLAWYLRHAQTRQLSHPLPVLRAREVDRWARSGEFRALLEKGVPLQTQVVHQGSTPPAPSSPYPRSTPDTGPRDAARFPGPTGTSVGSNSAPGMDPAASLSGRAFNRLRWALLGGKDRQRQF